MKEDFNYYHGCKTFLACERTLHAKEMGVNLKKFQKDFYLHVKGKNKVISSIQMHQWSFKLENLDNLIGSTKKFLHS
jgi:hypothetical protein